MKDEDQNLIWEAYVIPTKDHPLRWTKSMMGWKNAILASTGEIYISDEVKEHVDMYKELIDSGINSPVEQTFRLRYNGANVTVNKWDMEEKGWPQLNSSQKAELEGLGIHNEIAVELEGYNSDIGFPQTMTIYEPR